MPPKICFMFMLSLIMFELLNNKQISGKCQCGYLGPECEYRYNESLIDENNYYKYDVDEQQQQPGYECYLIYDNTVNCVCKAGFRLDSYGTCVEDLCHNYDCGNRGRCIVNLASEAECICLDEASSSSKSFECTAAYACETTMKPICNPAGSICHNFSHGQFKCECNSPLYSGVYCERVTNLCEQNLCQNGGTCVKMSPEEYCCLCLDGFNGEHCEEAEIIGTSSNPSAATSTTPEEYSAGEDDEEENYRSALPTSTTTSSLISTSTIKNCQNVENFCQNNGTCDYQSGKCDCLPIFKGDACEFVEDDCDSLNNKCEKNSTCLNYIGENNYECVCNVHSIYKIGKHCEHKIDYCYKRPCYNSGECVNKYELATYSNLSRLDATATSINDDDGLNFVCFCLPGYTGQLCEHELVNRCENSQCLNGALCQSKKNNALASRNKVFARRADDESGKDDDSNYKCICTVYFYGQYCELVNEEYNRIRVISKTVGVASAISIGLLYTYAVLMDLSNLFCKKKPRRTKTATMKSTTTTVV